jgi:hypothetical protein
MGTDEIEDEAVDVADREQRAAAGSFLETPIERHEQRDEREPGEKTERRRQECQRRKNTRDGRERKVTPAAARGFGAAFGDIALGLVELHLFALIGRAIHGVHQLHDRQDLLGAPHRLRTAPQRFGKVDDLRFDRLFVLVPRGVHRRG